MGGEYHGHLLEREGKLARVVLTSFQEDYAESTVTIELGQGLSRREKMDYAIQKAVELGVSRIVPLITEHCAVKLHTDKIATRLAHWHGILIHAAEQSGRSRVPEITLPIALATWLKEKKSESALSLVCDPTTKQPLIRDTPVKKINLLIGPEGGLSANEILEAKSSGFLGLSLGPRILRTETATVAALTLLQHQWGDLN